jgi:hypothetical protein
MDNLSEENANENIKIFSSLLTEIEKVNSYLQVSTRELIKFNIKTQFCIANNIVFN